MNAYRIRPDGSKQLQMLEQQSRGSTPRPTWLASRTQVSKRLNHRSTTLNAGKFGGDKSVFVNTAPQQGFGQAIYPILFRRAAGGVRRARQHR